VKGRIVQINVSPGGVPKTPVATAHVGVLGLEGDAHRDTENHGGPERAVCVYAMEAIRALEAEGHPIVAGAIGENVTVEGLDWSAVVPGTHLLLGVYARVVRPGSIRQGDPVRLLTDVEAAGVLARART
jgi:MOSC domain-containing protein YiiM